MLQNHVPCWHIRNRGCQSSLFDLYRPLVMVPATKQRISRIRRHECPHCVYIASRMKREWLLRPTPSPPENWTSERPWKQLGGHSHYCASLTPASDLPRRGRTDFPESFPRLCRGNEQRVSKGVHARGERPRGNLASALTIASRYPGVCTMRLFSENEENVTWKTDLRRVLRRVRHVLRRSQ